LLTRELPDIASGINTETPSNLQWVGMDDIAVPISIRMQDGSTQSLVAKSNVYVSLDKSDAKGIHMSRLHAQVNQLAALECNRESIDRLLAETVSSQQGISEQARIDLAFDLLLKKPALLSDESGYQAYPVKIIAEKTPQGFDYKLELVVTYSSTCPCSESLSRQLYAEAIDQAFNSEKIDKTQLLEWIQSPAGSVATPHSQRSHAYIHLSLNDGAWPDIASLIFEFEKVISTPVQTAVKRVDEQEFARLNATNLMFCEDAARRFKNSLEQMTFIRDYWCKVEHKESLHAHNAVAIVSK
jgi:GTP cyclohydrolase I